jgi:hypothetical protein
MTTPHIIILTWLALNVVVVGLMTCAGWRRR